MNTKVKLDLTSIDSNAFSLMGAFKKAARKQGWNSQEIDVVINDCMTGDYNHLIRTLMANVE